MSTLSLVPLFWFAGGCGLLWLFHARTLIRLWREPALAAPVVIVESDDWGPGPVEDAEVLCSTRTFEGASPPLSETTKLETVNEFLATALVE